MDMSLVLKHFVKHYIPGVDARLVCNCSFLDHHLQVSQIGGASRQSNIELAMSEYRLREIEPHSVECLALRPVDGHGKGWFD